jgi:putative spermidine/putrescine transport system ATP-binding protein
LTDSNEPIVQFIGVEKTYDGETNVIKGLDLEIRRGEFLTLLGPSGSGKTTTLLMLAGFEEPTAGEITLAGRSLRKVPPYARNMGIVFQNYALFPHMTVEDNVAFPLVQRKLSKADIAEKVARVLEIVKLEPYRKRRPRQLSGGQQQRVALARALVFEPEVVLMDEPLGALDKKLREHMQLEIKHIHENLGLTVVYVTHDQQEALTMSDRVAVFDDGIIQQIDVPDRLYEYPNNSFVADFIGESNTLAGTVAELNGATCTVVLDGGERVTARPVNIAGIGARTTLSIRPERVAIRPNGTNYLNRFPAEVMELIYLGDQTRIRVRVVDNENFMLKAPIGGEANTPRIGDVIDIGWEAEFCRALDPV